MEVFICCWQLRCSIYSCTMKWFHHGFHEYLLISHSQSVVNFLDSISILFNIFQLLPKHSIILCFVIIIVYQINNGRIITGICFTIGSIMDQQNKNSHCIFQRDHFIPEAIHPQYLRIAPSFQKIVQNIKRRYLIFNQDVKGQIA